MIRNFISTILIFVSTFRYFLKSFRKDASVIELKQQWALDILKRFDMKLKVTQSPTNEKQAILVGNHISYLDIIVLLAVFPKVVFLAKREIASWPIIGVAAKRIGTVFVSRESRDSRGKARYEISQMLKKRNEIFVAGFPSGTTCLTESKPWKKGLFEIAKHNEVVIQPFRIIYTPMRECSYVEQDNLFLSLMNLFKTKNKTIFFEWGEEFNVSQHIDSQIEQTKSWCSRQTDAENKKNLYPKKIKALQETAFQENV